MSSYQQAENERLRQAVRERLLESRRQAWEAVQAAGLEDVVREVVAHFGRLAKPPEVRRESD